MCVIIVLHRPYHTWHNQCFVCDVIILPSLWCWLGLSPELHMNMSLASRFLRFQSRNGLFRVVAWIRTQSTAAGKAALCKLLLAPPTMHWHCQNRLCLSWLSQRNFTTLTPVDYTLLLSPAAAAPEAYTVIPPQPLEKKPGQLEKWQLEQFFDKGFVQVNNFFTKEELQPALKVSR